MCGRGRLREVPTVGIRLGKIWCFERLSVMGGGRTWRFDCISSVQVQIQVVTRSVNPQRLVPMVLPRVLNFLQPTGF